MSLSVCFIGAGNVATQMAKAFRLAGINISSIYSRTEKSARELGEILSTKYVTSADEIDHAADMFIIALKDAAVKEVLSQIKFNNKLVVHVSGSLPLSVLAAHSKNRGVLYPLQTFSKKRAVDFRTIPVFIEANTPENEQFLHDLATQISDSVQALSSEKRKTLHIAAVFACNFVNHLYAVAAEILQSKNLSFDVLKPLIAETAQKVQVLSPREAQTGPALRFDENIILAHLEQLKEFDSCAQLYRLLSENIFDYHKKSD